MFLTFHATIQPVIYPSSNYSTSQPSTKHRVIRRAIYLSIDQSSHSYISNFCTHRPSFQPTKHLIIQPFTKLYIVHPSGINLSVHLTTKSAIQPFIRRAFITSIDTSNQPYSSKLSTHRPSFQPPKHLIIHFSTKLSIQSVIHSNGINLSIHLNNQPATHLIIQPKSFCLINQPSVQSAIHPSI